MTVHKLVEKDILIFAHGVSRHITIFEKHYLCGSSPSWYSAEREFSGVTSAGLSPSRTPLGGPAQGYPPGQVEG